MKPTDPRFWIFLLSVSAGLGYGYSRFLSFDEKLDQLQSRLVALELKSLRPNRMAVLSVTPPSPETAFRTELYGLLQKLNQVHSVHDANKPKRVLLQENRIEIVDPSVAQEDVFFDLLGRLLDEDGLDHLVLPPPSQTEKRLRAYFRTLRQELIRFGIPDEQIRSAQRPDFVIVLKSHPKNSE